MQFEALDETRSRLGESPYWWAERETFLQVDVHAGEVYRFSLFHLLPIDDHTALFPVELIAIGGEA